MKRIPPEERLIVALDVPGKAEALRWVRRLSKAGVRHFKVGSELFTAAGPDTVRRINAMDAKVFLDLKFFDIPNTMAGALESAAPLEPFLVNIHALAGPAAIERCIAALRGLKPPPKLLAVTILTSFSEAELKKIGFTAGVKKMVARLCGMALKAGADGVVASPNEAPVLRKKFGGEFLIVTPGVRPSWAAKNDQQRVATPAEAIRNGADYIVVGRPILSAERPVVAARRVLDEIRGECG